MEDGRGRRVCSGRGWKGEEDRFWVMGGKKTAACRYWRGRKGSRQHTQGPSYTCPLFAFQKDILKRCPASVVLLSLSIV